MNTVCTGPGPGFGYCSDVVERFLSSTVFCLVLTTTAGFLFLLLLLLLLVVNKFKKAGGKDGRWTKSDERAS